MHTITAFVIVLAVLLVIGAIAKVGTLLHSFAVAFDAFVQDLLWNDELAITISSRAGLAARRGVLWPQRVVNFIMRSPTHCQDAIKADLARAQQAIAVLQGGKP